jgi:antitoxin (DNA-binding transcriptional repressor) of toxin-antitoxin stability system
MTNSVGVHEAKAQLSVLLRRVTAGEEIVITRRGREVARSSRLRPARIAGWASTGDDGSFLTTSTRRCPTT